MESLGPVQCGWQAGPQHCGWAAGHSTGSPQEHYPGAPPALGPGTWLNSESPVVNHCE